MSMSYSRRSGWLAMVQQCHNAPTPSADAHAARAARAGAPEPIRHLSRLAGVVQNGVIDYVGLARRGRLATPFAHVRAGNKIGRDDGGGGLSMRKSTRWLVVGGASALIVAACTP